MSFNRLGWNSFGVDLLSLFLCFYLLGIIFSHSLLESLSTLTFTNMFDSDMDSLGNKSVTNSFSNDNTHSVLSHIKYLSCFPMVEFVWHTFVDASISDNVNKVSFSVGGKDLSERSGTVLSEPFLEEMSCFRPISKMMRHLYSKYFS